MRPIPLSIVIMGVSGSGKSTIGQLVAASLACPYLEGDAFHSVENIAKMSRGIPLDDIDRWPWLDRLGTALGEAASQNGCAIAACSALKRSYRDRLRHMTQSSVAFVHLTTNRHELDRRLRARPGHYMPPSLLDSQLASLEPLGDDELSSSFDGAVAATLLVERISGWIGSLNLKDQDAG